MFNGAIHFDIVVVGSGQAGFQTAASLRQEGFEGSILIIGEEPGLPYQRPPLSKTYLKEGVTERLFIRDAAGEYRANLGFPGQVIERALPGSGGYPDLRVASMGWRASSVFA
jgi:NADPH-dependent 2,4-dienoyl-CoA reductase/sulfur reductase-like enzyme